MTRILLAFATVLFASVALFNSGAQACISCSYTPEVVNTPNPNAAKRNKYKSHQAKRKPSSNKRKAARKKPPATQAKKTKPPVAAPRQAAKEDAPNNEAVKDETVVKDETAAKDEDAKTAATESPPRVSGSSVLMQHSIPRQEEPVAAAEAEETCKKFVPAVGATVSVACD